MGGLHLGHSSLIEAAAKAKTADGSVLVSSFVNPLQFGVHWSCSLIFGEHDKEHDLGALLCPLKCPLKSVIVRLVVRLKFITGP